ncbi:MAG: SCO family protein [Rickettsiales bacterium]
MTKTNKDFDINIKNNVLLKYNQNNLKNIHFKQNEELLDYKNFNNNKIDYINDIIDNNKIDHINNIINNLNKKTTFTNINNQIINENINNETNNQININSQNIDINIQNKIKIQEQNNIKEYISNLTIPNFSLINQNNEIFNLYDIKDKFKIIYFGFAHCPKICPEILYYLTDIVKDLQRYNKAVQIIFISIDPERDSPEILKNFLQYFDSDIIGLTGSKDQINAVVQNFGAYYNVDTQENSGGFNHSLFIYVISPENKYVSIFYKEDSKQSIIKQILNYKYNN